MSTALAQQNGTASLATLDQQTILSLVSGGDCSKLNAAQKTAYYSARCEAAGLDPRAQPFAFVKLSGKEVLYAQKSASDQLAAKHGVRLSITSQATEDGIRIVTVRAEAKDGRVTEEIGALPIKGLQGEALANALMKCVTKAKRRAVLSLCGLGMLDEFEVDSVPGAQPVQPAQPAALPVAAPAREVTVEVLPPTREDVADTKASAAALVDAAAEVEAPGWKQTTAERNRAVLLYRRVKDRLTWPMFLALVQTAVGKRKDDPGSWTTHDLDRIEQAIEKGEVVP